MEWDFQHSTAEPSYQELLMEEDWQTPGEGGSWKVESVNALETLIVKRRGERHGQSKRQTTLAWK